MNEINVWNVSSGERLRIDRI